MVRHGNRGDGAGWGMVRKSSYINQKLVKWSTCHKLLAESAGTPSGHIICHSYKVHWYWPEIERPQRFWMQRKIIRNAIPDVNNVYTICPIRWLSVGRLFVVSPAKNKRQWRVNDFNSFIFDNQSAAVLCHSKVNVLAGVIAKKAIDKFVARSKNWASTERHQLLGLHLEKSNGYVVILTQNRTIGHLSRQKWLRQYHCHMLKMRINGAWKVVSLASRKMLWMSGNINR